MDNLYLKISSLLDIWQSLQLYFFWTFSLWTYSYICSLLWGYFNDFPLCKWNWTFCCSNSNGSWSNGTRIFFIRTSILFVVSIVMVHGLSMVHVFFYKNIDTGCSSLIVLNFKYFCVLECLCFEFYLKKVRKTTLNVF